MKLSLRQIGFTLLGLATSIGINALPVTAATPDAMTLLRQAADVQQQIATFQAFYTQESVSGAGGAVASIEKGFVKTKGLSTRKDIQSPKRKCLITTADKQVEKDPDTGAILSKSESQHPGGSPLIKPNESLDALSKQFQFGVPKETSDSWILTGNSSKLAVTLTLDKTKMVVTHLVVSMDQVPTVWVDNQYVQLQSHWVLSGTTSKVSVLLGKTRQDIKVTLSYEGIQINQDIPDSDFN